MKKVFKKLISSCKGIANVFLEFVKNFSLLLWKYIKNFNIGNLNLGNCKIKISKYGRNTILFFMVLCFISLICFGLGFLTTALLFLLLFVSWFFRDPDRIVVKKNNSVISPSDGIILNIETASLPEELNINDNHEYTKISVFLALTDVHIQRIPVDGIIKQVEYVNGTFINASFDKASKDNERNYIVIERNNGDKVCVAQIAGLVSRRIVCDVKKDEVCSIGERYGIIKFGSRIELYVPKNYKIEVLAGQRVIGGETVMASF